MLTTVAAALLAATLAPPGATALPAFDLPDNEAAQRQWAPQFGSRPVRVEPVADGGTCLVLGAEFTGPDQRACWDWKAQLDLSRAGRIGYRVAVEGREAIGANMLYFGTPGGWYATHDWLGGAAWTARALTLGTFGTEDEPAGWDRVETLRLSIWSRGPGKVVIRLQGLWTAPVDPAENLLKNGSFEIVSGGLPYAWSSGHWGVGHLPWAADMDSWRRSWSVDDAVARHGRVSLKIVNREGVAPLRAVSVWLTPPRGLETMVASAWLRADRAGLPVTLSCGGKNVRVEVGLEWTQAVLPGIARGEHLVVSVAPAEAGTLWIDAVQLQRGEVATADYHARFEDHALAVREAAVDWSPPRRTPEVAAGRGRGEPVTAATVRIDDRGRFLLDGEPYLQHSLGLEFVSDPAILDFVADAGFRDVCIQIHPGVSTAELVSYAERCAAVGLRLIPWLDGRISRDVFAEHIRALKNQPAVLCWYVYDEPSGDRFAEADARVALAKELDPSRPAFVNYLPNHLTDQTGDIYSTDVYPIPHGSVMDAIRAVSTMRGAAGAKPVWMWLQGTGYAYWMDREPTPRELSCMVYGSLLVGARGIYYFAQVPRSKACWEEMRALLVEVSALAPALGSLDPAPVVTADGNGLLYGAFREGPRVTVLAVNTTATALTATFTCAGAEGPLEVLFEDRTVTAVGGRWSDDFGPFERRVYRIP